MSPDPRTRPEPAPHVKQTGQEERYPSVPAPDPEADPAEKVEEEGEPFDGNFA